MSYDLRDWFPNTACWMAFAAAFLTWWATEEVYKRLGRDERRIVYDRGSRKIATASIYAGVTISFLLRAMGWGELSAVLQFSGIALMFIGILFRAWSIRLLGRHFSVQVAVQPEHRLITSGPYRWIRHPCYTGTMLTVMGIPLAIGLWGLTPLVGILFLAGHFYRIRVEEEVLTERFGAEYVEYRCKTCGIFPGW